VGLKHEAALQQKIASMPPQSNQRGIETLPAVLAGQADTEPQSNQRGIETPKTPNLLSQKLEASIEPAWD